MMKNMKRRAMKMNLVRVHKSLGKIMRSKMMTERKKGTGQLIICFTKITPFTA